MRRLTADRTTESSIYRITTARKSVADDQAARVRGYVISMTIRIVCFLLAVVTTGVVRWLFVAGALIIPYIAVVYANGGRERSEGEPETLRSAPDRELPSGIDPSGIDPSGIDPSGIDPSGIDPSGMDSRAS